MSINLLMKNILFFFIILISFNVYAFEKVSVGSIMYNACKNLYFHEKPTAFSKKISTIKFGQQIKVQGLERKFDYLTLTFLQKNL